MPTQYVQVGVPFQALQNVIYALPNSRCLLFCDTAAATIQQANDVAFAVNQALTLSSGQAEVAGGFFRVTSGNVLVSLKRF
jgi:hypothetical protein